MYGYRPERHEEHWRREEIIDILKTIRPLGLSDSGSAKRKPSGVGIATSSGVVKTDKSKKSPVTGKADASISHVGTREVEIHKKWSTPPEDLEVIKRLGRGGNAEVWVSLLFPLHLMCQVACHLLNSFGPTSSPWLTPDLTRICLPSLFIVRP